MLSGITDAKFLLGPVFLVGVISLVAHGWTLARLLGLRARPNGLMPFLDSTAVVRMTGIVFELMGATIVLPSAVRKPNS
jgi:hypothetical protein